VDSSEDQVREGRTVCAPTRTVVQTWQHNIFKNRIFVRGSLFLKLFLTLIILTQIHGFLIQNNLISIHPKWLISQKCVKRLLAKNPNFHPIESSPKHNNPK